ncbi:MAG: hypothetical protein M3137_16105 [Actinomycetota bacterium]|nr:hypothetical protein [Actinomycetota bacterium]
MKAITRTGKRRTGAIGACMAVALAGSLAACGSSTKTSTTKGGNITSALPAGQPGAGKPPITMGDKNFEEQYILGFLYTGALQSKGYTVNLKPSIGSSEIIDKALTSGQIDMYPEYTGVIYQVLAGHTDNPPTAQVTYDVSQKFEQSRGFTLLKQTPFQDADGVATAKPYAAQHHLKTIDDLKNVGPFSYGGPPENLNRLQGVLGLQQEYGLSNLKFVPLTSGSQYQALDAGQVNSIAIFTTDGQLLSGKYAVLDDTKHIFGFQNVAPLVKNSLLQSEGPAFNQILDAVSAKLTFPAIQQMNSAVVIAHQSPQTVAKQFLDANGLG